jgi:predicted alpha/beta superfamily hydrolase
MRENAAMQNVQRFSGAYLFWHTTSILGVCFWFGLGLIAGCSKPVPQDLIPEHESFEFVSKKLNETRVICVWLPPEYSQGNESFPVLYMPDGGVREDFPHIANTVAELVKNKEIAPLILVGIENTERRRDLTGPSEVAADAQIAPVTDGSRVFREFIRGELFPEVERRYRTNGERAIIGESVAGLFVVETCLLAPTMFDIHIAMDPSLYWNDRYLVRTAVEHLANSGSQPSKLWFAGSDAIDILPHTDNLATVLEQSAPPSLIWKYSRRPDQQHQTIFRATKVEAMRWALWPAK